MSPSIDVTGTRVGPMLIFEGVEKVVVWKAEELGEEYARIRMEFKAGGYSEHTIPLKIYDNLLKVERDLVRFKKRPRARLEE